MILNNNVNASPLKLVPLFTTKIRLFQVWEKKNLKLFAQFYKYFANKSWNLLIYSVLIIVSNHSETIDQNSVGSLTYSPHPAKHTPWECDKFGW